MAVRTAQEVFAHHGQALGAADLDGIVADYSDDALFITPKGVKQGKAGVREGFVQLLADLPDANVGAPDADLRRRHPAARVEGRRLDQQGGGRHRHLRVPRRTHPRADGALHAHPEGLMLR